MSDQEKLTYFDDSGEQRSVATDDREVNYGIKDVSLNGGTQIDGYIDTTDGKNFDIENDIPLLMTNIDGTDEGEMLAGTDGDDNVDGGAGNDILVGTTGNDILTGGDGVDQFVWRVASQGDDVDDNADIITDFHTGSGGDVLDLSDILQNETDTLEDFLSLNFENGDTIIEVKPEGNDQVTQKITLQGVDLSSYGGGTTDAEILNNLIDDGNLQV